MEKKIFVINGNARSGKDSFVKYVSLELNDICKQFHTVVNFDSVGYIKNFEKNVNPSDFDAKNKTEKYRKFLSDFKKLMDDYCDLSYVMIKNKIDEFMCDENAVSLFIHIREPENIKRIVKDYNAITILIQNNHVSQIMTNDSDKRLFDFDYDYVIYNNEGLDKLRNMANRFVKEVIV